MSGRSVHNRKKGKNGILGLVIAVVLAVGGMYAKDNLSDKDGKSQTVIPAEGDMQVHFIDVGQGDCTLITCDGKSMLIDAGDNSKGTAVQSYLQQQNIISLEYVIGTHPDADHIGGLDVVITKFDCETIIMPDITADTATYRDVIDAIEYKNYKITTPVPGDTYYLGSALITVVGPIDNYSDTNNNSVSVIIQHGKNRFLFTGDAEEEAENDMLDYGIDLDCDVYQAGHHGSRTASTEQFLEAANPKYVVISCGEDNKYGHPHAEPLNRFRTMGIKMFRTDEQGTIVAVSDGETITWNMSPSEDWSSGE